MRFLVENGLSGCALAVERHALAVVVDALRASANIASLFHYGAERLMVVERVEEAFAQRDIWPGAALVGERGGPIVPGFDLGNSPLQAPPAVDVREVIFSSSNCSRCCVGIEGAAAAFIGTTVNATATARALLRAADQLRIGEVVLVTAGAVEDEVRLTLEDHVAAGAIMASCRRLGAEVAPGNDRSEVCRALFGDGSQAALTKRFLESENGAALSSLGLGADVEFAARLDVLDIAVRITQIVPLSAGGRGAVLARN